MKFKLQSSKAGALFAGASLLAFAGALPAFADYQSTVLSQNPSAYWRLNETTVPPVPPIFAANAGSVGSAGNGTYSNGVVRGVSGALAGDANTAAHFPQSAGNRVRIPYQPQWNQTGPFSVEFWAKPAQTGALACPAASVNFIATPTQRDGWLIYQGDSTLGTGNGFVFRQYNSTGLANQTGVATNIAIDVTKWYHVVGTFDGTTLRIYVNGALGQSAAIAGTARANTNSAIPLAFGARSDGGSGFFEYAGDLDECAVYTSALNASQVLAHYQAGTNPAPITAYSALVLGDAPAGYWRLGDPGDPAAVNLGTLGSSANGKFLYNAMPNQTGPTPSSTPTPFPGFESGNKAVGFDGVSGSVTMGALNLNTNAVTLTCWINAGGSQAPGASVFLNQGSATVAKAGLQFDQTTGTGLAYNWNSIASGVNWASGVSVTPGQWTFAALMIQPDKAVLYVPGQTPATNFAVHPILAFDGQSFIGSGGAEFNGAIDEVALFNRTLSLGEAYTEYAAAVGGLGPQVFADPTSPANPLFAGDTLTLVVDAGGTPNLTYQWRKDSNPIGGATGSSYSKPNIATGDSGTYDVVINNGFGTATSAGAVISISAQTAPAIAQAPVGRTLYQGGTLSLNVSATGGGLQYQWIKNGTSISGATGSSYTVASVTTNNAGSYTVTVSNGLGSPTAGPAVVAIPLLTNGTYAAAVAGDAPEAWWRLDETSGSVMFDAMGRHDGFYSNSNGGLTLGAAGAISNGIFGSALSCNGTADFGSVPYSPALNGGAFSVEAWVYMTNAVNFVVPVSSHDSPAAGYAFDTQSSSWFGFIGINGTDYVFGQAGAGFDPTIKPGQWTHLVITCQASGGFPLQIFINGTTDGFIWGDFTRNTAAAFLIGALGHGTNGADRGFVGRVDEVAVYGKALTQAQVQNHYNIGIFLPNTPPFFTTQPQSVTALVGSNVTLTASALGTTPIAFQWLKNSAPIAGKTTTTLGLTNLYYTDAGNYSLRATNAAGVTTSAVAVVSVVPFPTFANVTNGLVVHLPFDGAYGDTSGRGNNATPQSINGGTPTFVAGKIGSQAFHYFTLTTKNGINDDGTATATNGAYASLGVPADLTLGSSQNFSIAYWVRLPAGYVLGDLPFFCSAPNSYGNLGVTFAPSYTQGGWSWSLGNVSSSVGIYGAASSINDGNWHHLVHTFDRNGNGTTYLDGAQVNATSIAGIGDIDSTGDFNIGQDTTGAYAEQGSGDIDDLGVWLRVLTQPEAQNMYLVGKYLSKSFDTYGPVSITSKSSGGNLDISWQAGTLQEAPTVSGPWTAVSGATPPFYRVAVPSSGNKFYRIQL
jgi:hypothetical protein